MQSVLGRVTRVVANLACSHFKCPARVEQTRISDTGSADQSILAEEILCISCSCSTLLDKELLSRGFSRDCPAQQRSSSWAHGQEQAGKACRGSPQKSGLASQKGTCILHLKRASLDGLEAIGCFPLRAIRYPTVDQDRYHVMDGAVPHAEL